MAFSQYSKPELANLFPCEFKLESCPRSTVILRIGIVLWSLLLSPVACWVVFSEKSTPVCCGVELLKWADQVNIQEFGLYLLRCQLEEWDSS